MSERPGWHRDKFYNRTEADRFIAYLDSVNASYEVKRTVSEDQRDGTMVQTEVLFPLKAITKGIASGKVSYGSR